MFLLIFLMGVRSEVLDLIASRVAEICEIKVNDIFLKGKQQKRVIIKGDALLKFNYSGKYLIFKY